MNRFSGPHYAIGMNKFTNGYSLPYISVYVLCGNVRRLFYLTTVRFHFLLAHV